MFKVLIKLKCRLRNFLVQSWIMLLFWSEFCSHTFKNKLDGSHLLFLISFFNKSRIIPTQGKLKTTEFFNNMSRILKEKQLTSPTMTNRSTNYIKVSKFILKLAITIWHNLAKLIIFVLPSYFNMFVIHTCFSNFLHIHDYL